MESKFIGYKVVDGQFIPVMEGDELPEVSKASYEVTEEDLNWRDSSGISQYDWARGRTYR